jgi:hypothetical protein
MIRTALLSLALISAVPALGAAADAFAAGKFAEATAAGRKEATDASLIIASRGASTRAAWLVTEKLDAKVLLDAANADIDKVLARSPGNLDALLQRGVTTGYIAKLTKSPGLAKDARKDFEAVLAKRPNDPLALAAMGGWHGESVATLGKFLAGTALGAKEGEALRYFDRAAASSAGDPAVPLFYATTLLNLSAKNAAKAQGLLARAVKAQPADGFDRLMQRNARAILTALEAGDVDGARATAKRLGPLGNLE